MKTIIKFIFFICFANILVLGQDEKEKNNLLSLTNLGAPSINVTIGGNFIITGSFPALINERVDQYVTRVYFQASTITKLEELPEEFRRNRELYEHDFALRDITLKRTDGTEQKLDLAKFRISGDFKYNPFLKNDDVIIFPRLNPENNFIFVSGAINRPGKIQFVEGDKLQDVIFLSQGLNPAYEGVDTIIISRLSYDGNNEEKLFFHINENPSLKRGDRIIFSAPEPRREDFKILIYGEVSKPGFIPITKNNTTLSEVIKKAGGFRDNADLKRAELIRGISAFVPLMISENFEELLMRRMANITDEDSLTFLIDNRLRFSRANAALDFAKLFDDKSMESNFIVRDGDVIHIPEQINLVYVYGQVNNPGYVNFKEGADVNYYINNAGGTGATAKDEIYLIHGKTRSWTLIEDNIDYVIEAGDFIWIPKQIPRTFEYYMSLSTTLAGIIGSIATVILLIVNITK